MALYSIDSLIEETRRLAAEFRRSTGTMLPVSGEIARFDVCHQLNLTPNEDRSSGYDAVGNDSRAGLKVQIKSRVIGEKVKSGHRIGQLNLEMEWDLIILSLMNNDFEAVEMYEMDRQKITDVICSNGNKAKRGAISVAKFKIMGDLVWSKENGVMPQSTKE